MCQHCICLTLFRITRNDAVSFFSVFWVSFLLTTSMFESYFFLGYVWFLKKIEGKYKGKKIERISRRKEKVKENKK